MRASARHLLGMATLVLLTCAVVGRARAGPAAGLPPPAGVVKHKLSPWDDGEPRPFVGGYVDAGAVFARPAMQLGYGRPHWQWFGVEAYALTTNSFFAAYAGTRASLPFVDFTMGVRDTWSYVRPFVPARGAYDASDVDRADDRKARYLTLDYELSGVVPLPGGYLIWGFVASRVLDAPAGMDVFEEGLRVVLRPPFVADFRGGYVAALGHEETVKVGVLSETLVIPARRATVVRLGPVAAVTLTAHTEALFVLTAVLHSPDTLGLFDGAYGFAGVRYRWATGEKAPHFP
jgi:hypothetical protein